VSSVPARRVALDLFGLAAVAGLVLFVIGAVVLSLFPRATTVARDGVLMGVVAHTAGFGWGVVLSAATGHATDDG
jgi:putative effector of murein hydrolase